MNPEKSTKPGLIIKLSSETVQKLQEVSEAQSGNEVDLNKNASPEVLPKEEISVTAESNSTEIETRSKLTTSVDSTEVPSTADKQPGNESSEWGDYAPYVTYEGETAIYTDPSTQTQYTWDSTTNTWVPKSTDTSQSGRVYSYENDKHVYTDPDGSKCFWDEDKKAWFPKVDDDFLAHYQLSYGFIDNVTKEEPVKEEPVTKKADESGALKRKAAEPPKWFDVSDDKNNTKVYVSNLPDELTEEEFVDFMQKCGLVMRDPSTQKMKIKLYTDKANGCFKGDALCTYIKVESVDLALNILDGSDFKGKKVSVQRAQFQLKGEYNPALKPKKKKKKELEKIKRMQEKLFSWRPEKIVGERNKNERVVIVKNLFDPTDFDKEVQLILDYQQDLREECGKCGEVRKVVLYDRHPEGVAQITMKEPEEADAVIALINGRWFGKRQITAEIWDGRTKYRIAETDADMNKRVDKWEKFLEEGETKNAENDEKSEPKESGDIVKADGVPQEYSEKEAVQQSTSSDVK